MGSRGKVRSEEVQSNNWRTSRLEELATVIDSRHKTPKYSEDGLPMVRVVDVKAGPIDLSNAVKVTQEVYEDFSKGRDPEIGDLIISRVGSYGNICYVKTNEKFCLGQNTAFIVPKINWRFLYYQLLSPQVRTQIESLVVGAVQKTISLKNIKSLEIATPSKSEQKAIAHILGTLDDKIELNRRMNETLEAMAQALFKSWFVDFDPVKAKMEGRQPEGMDAETAALFPDKLVESELGLIPEGWEVGCLKDVATNIRETVKPKDLRDTVPYIGLEHMPKKSIALSQWEYADKVTSNKSRFKSGDFLFGKLRPYFHKVGTAVIDGICSTDILVIRPMDENYYSFVISYISSEEFIDYTDRLSNGAKMPRTNWKDMGKYQIPLPSTEIARCFLNVVKPLYEKIARNIYQTKELSAARDALLPKLISGQIDTGSQT